jgi:hypothetical protein
MPGMPFRKMQGAQAAASSTKAEAESVKHIEKGIKKSMAKMKPLGGEHGTVPNTNPIEIEDLRSPVNGKWTKGKKSPKKSNRKKK